MSQNDDLAAFAVQYAMSKGADEAQAGLTTKSHISITRRGGEIEEATEASSRGLSVSLMVDGKYSSCTTSDLRQGALEKIIDKTVEAATFLETDLNRALASLEQSETTRDGSDLDLTDHSYANLSADDREEYVANLEAETLKLPQQDVISGAVSYSDGFSRWHRVNSNGFDSVEEGTWFSAGGELSLRDGDKMPEGGAYFSAVHFEDLPSIEAIAAAIHHDTRAKVGAAPLPSGKYPMFLNRDVVGRLLGMFLSPLSGGAIYKKKSCFLDAVGTALASEHLTLVSDPTLPRGFSSEIWDGDNRAVFPRTLLDKGVLQDYNIGLYNSRRMGVEPTGGISNLVVSPGSRSDSSILNELSECIVVTGFLGGNSNATSGDFSLGVTGMLYRNGQPVSAVSEMNLSGNLATFFHSLVEVARDPWMFSGIRSPSLLFENCTFSGS